MLSTGVAGAGSDTAELGLPDPVRELAERLGRDDAAPPAYVYDLDGLAAHLAGIRAAIPSQVEIFYAVKANPDPAVLRAVAQYADGLEVASGGELGHTAATVCTASTWRAFKSCGCLAPRRWPRGGRSTSCSGLTCRPRTRRRIPSCSSHEQRC